MINKLGYTIPQYQQKQAFKGKKEVELIKATTKGLDKKTSGNISNICSRMNEVVKKVENKDIDDAVKEIGTWHAEFIQWFKKK